MLVQLGAIQRSHRDRLREILDSTGVFRDEEIAVALELFDETFADRPVQASSEPADDVADYEFIGSFARDGRLIGYVCFGATPGTDHTYDLYWIAVEPTFQHAGSGTLLMEEVEHRLQQRKARLLVVETSSRDGYAATRRFYAARGYAEAARIRSYYAPGDHRVIFTKRIAGTFPLTTS